jgi:hypothetical protein
LSRERVLISDIATIDDFPQIDDQELELAASLYFKKFHRLVETKAKLSFREALLITTAMLFILDYQLRVGQISREQYENQANSAISHFKQSESEYRSKSGRGVTSTTDTLFQHVADQDPGFFSEVFRFAYSAREYIENHPAVSSAIDKAQGFRGWIFDDLAR